MQELLLAAQFLLHLAERLRRRLELDVPLLLTLNRADESTWCIGEKGARPGGAEQASDNSRRGAQARAA